MLNSAGYLARKEMFIRRLSSWGDKYGMDLVTCARFMLDDEKTEPSFRDPFSFVEWISFCEDILYRGNAK